MALTVTRLSKIPKTMMGQFTMVAVSIKFDTNYATTGGEVLGTAAKTVTLCPNHIYAMWIIGKQPLKLTNAPLQVQFTPGTNFRTTTAAIKLFRQWATATATSAGFLIRKECSTTNDLSTTVLHAFLVGD